MRLDEHKIAAVVLGAGISSRMGERHKLILPLPGGSTVLEQAVKNAVGWHPVETIVVMQPGMDDLREAVERQPVKVVLNSRYASGMASSLRAGIEALPEEVEAVLVLLGDQPSVAGSIIESLVEAFQRERKPITIPVYGDLTGPPTLFRREVFPELLALTGDEGARSVVRPNPARVAKVPLPAGAMPLDIDTPEDYERYMAGREV